MLDVGSFAALFRICLMAKDTTQIFHIKKSLLIVKSHLQKHVETLEDTAYVHVFATLQLPPP